MDRLIGWLSPILSTIIITAATASINAHLQRSQKLADERHAETEAKRKTEAEWREGVTKRLDDIEDKLGRSISQCTSAIGTSTTSAGQAPRKRRRSLTSTSSTPSFAMTWRWRTTSSTSLWQG